jgi:hypothetical protein
MYQNARMRLIHAFIVLLGTGCSLPEDRTEPAAPSTASSAAPTSLAPAVACNRARVAAHDCWRSLETELESKLGEAQAVVDETAPNKLPPAWMVPDGTFERRSRAQADTLLLRQRLLAVHTARESSLRGAVRARDDAEAAEKLVTDPAATNASNAAWAACRDIAPGDPS